MPKNRKYYPDYSKLYPGVDIPADVLTALRQSDRKMKYMEYDLKAEQPVRDENGSLIALLPGREDSLERLMETDKQFMAIAPSPEEIALEYEETKALRCGLTLLTEDERALIHALFVDRLTEREYARRIGISQPRVSQRWSRIKDKLKNYLQNN